MNSRPRGRATKLLIYSHFFAPSVGGVETSVIALAKGLSEIAASSRSEKFDVTVVAQTPAGLFDDKTLNFRVTRQPNLFKLVGLILESDVVHLAGPSLLPQLLCYLARKPIVLE